MSSCSAASRREAPPSTRAITRMRMSAEYAFGIVRPPDESMPPDSPIYRSLGNLRFYSARTCSRQANDALAATVSKYPDRLLGFATLPMLDHSAEVRELERTVRNLPCDGPLLNTTIHCPCF